MIEILNIIVVSGLTVLGVSLIPGLAGAGVTPLLSLFFIIGLTYFRGGFWPILIAALSGAMLDFYSASVFGLYLGIFLLIAVFIRFTFQEGMEELSFGHYLAICGVAILLIFVLEILILRFTGASVGFRGMLEPFFGYFVVNILSAVLVYYFNVKYFEATKKVEYYQKRR